MSTRPEARPDPAYGLPLPSPGTTRPIVIVGAGGIVRDAHLPAYRGAGFPVHALVDPDRSRAEELAHRYGVPHVFADVRDARASAPEEAVWDVAVPPQRYPELMRLLPRRSGVLVQKPLGTDLETARILHAICLEREYIAAVNTQLRFAPVVAEARRLIAEDTIGELVDLEIRMVIETPWSMFPNVRGLPRLEIASHSIHYLDLVRSFVGDPAGIDAISVPFPGSGLSATRTAMLLRYPERPLRVTISVDHDHVYGPRHQESAVRWEGTKGALRAQLGVLLDYPRGAADSLEVARRATAEAGWTDVPVSGSWFPDAFAWSMGALQDHLAGRSATLPHSVDDVVRTMELVDAAERSAGLRE